MWRDLIWGKTSNPSLAWKKGDVFEIYDDDDDVDDDNDDDDDDDAHNFNSAHYLNSAYYFNSVKYFSSAHYFNFAYFFNSYLGDISFSNFIPLHFLFIICLHNSIYFDKFNYFSNTILSILCVRNNSS